MNQLQRDNTNSALCQRSSHSQIIHYFPVKNLPLHFLTKMPTVIPALLKLK